MPPQKITRSHSPGCLINWATNTHSIHRARRARHLPSTPMRLHHCPLRHRPKRTYTPLDFLLIPLSFQPLAVRWRPSISHLDPPEHAWQRTYNKPMDTLICGCGHPGAKGLPGWCIRVLRDPLTGEPIFVFAAAESYARPLQKGKIQCL